MLDEELTDTQRMIKTAIRDYLVRESEPLVPELEAESVPPYDAIRKFVRDLASTAARPASSNPLATPLRTTTSICSSPPR